MNKCSTQHKYKRLIKINSEIKHIYLKGKKMVYKRWLFEKTIDKPLWKLKQQNKELTHKI